MDNTLVKEKMKIQPLWSIDEAISNTVSWTKEWLYGKDVRTITDSQIREYFNEKGVSL